MIRWIAILGVAALLITGTAMGVPKDLEAGTQPLQTQPEETTVTFLTEAEAKAAALAHAKLTQSQVTFLPSQFEKDHGSWEWEIEFFAEYVEYDYTVDALTGQILKWEKDIEKPPVTEVKPTQPAEQPPVTEPTPEILTAEEAKTIALNHAGLRLDQVSNLRVRRDRDDGIDIYEVEFSQGRVEFEYEIHSRTGKILDWEKDIDD